MCEIQWNPTRLTVCPHHALMCASEYLSTCRHPAVKSTVRVRKTSGYRLIVLPPIPELSCEPFRGILRVNYLVRGTQARFTTCPVCFQWEVSRVHSSKPRGLQRLRRGCRLPRHTPNFRRGQKGHGNFPCFEVDMRSPTVSTRGAIGSPCFAACVAQVFAGFRAVFRDRRSLPQKIRSAGSRV